jgi:uncharacterized membrane protein YraQ (UPF0718 family)
VLVNIISSSALAIAFGWKLGLTMVFAGLSVIVGSGYIRIRLDQKLEAWTEQQFASSAGLATEAVSSIRTVSLLTLETSVLREYSETLDAIVAKVIRSLVSDEETQLCQRYTRTVANTPPFDRYRHLFPIPFHNPPSSSLWHLDSGMDPGYSQVASIM